MTNGSRRVALFLAVCVGFASVGDAQATQAVTVPIAQRVPAVWPVASGTGAGLELMIVTMADPGHRHRCRAAQIGQDAIVCGGHHGRTYARQDVAALIRPAGNEGMPPVAELGAGALFLVTGLVFLVLGTAGTGAGVCLGVLAILTFVKAGRAKSGNDGPDVLLYLKPGERLSVPLR